MTVGELRIILQIVKELNRFGLKTVSINNYRDLVLWRETCLIHLVSNSRYASCETRQIRVA